MSLTDLDPDILQDFLTESNELLDALDANLIDLESNPSDPELLNGIFRALHTIKGSSGFLGLQPVTELSHISEDLLNKLRNDELTCSVDIITAILNAVDTLKAQVDQVSAGEFPEPAEQDILATLKQLVNADASDTPSEEAPTANVSTTEDKSGRTKLELGQSKLDLLEFMVLDLNETLTHIQGALGDIRDPESRKASLAELNGILDDMARAVAFFEIDVLTRETDAFVESIKAFESIPEQVIPALLQRLGALHWVFTERTTALADAESIDIPTDTLLNHIATLVSGESLPEAAQAPEDADTDAILQLDGVIPNDTPESADPADPAPKAAKKASSGNQSKAVTGDQTIRVSVDRLEAIMNLVGELVLQKNRVLSLSRQVGELVEDHEIEEEFSQVAADLDHVSGELQVGVMRTRLQQLNKLFSRYPRVIRDLAHATDKQIELVVEGGETEVDKSVIELLADPMVHILRNSADHGIESPDERVAAGKSAVGRITLAAEHQGSHVRVDIRDDGKGIDPEVIGKLIVKKGLATPEAVEAMTDDQIVRHVFAPGFSTASEVSDLSGRGVGMDVVNTNIAKLNGVVDVQSTKGQGTTVTIKIPLTLAIMQAMMIQVHDAAYAVPLTNILEIIKPQPEQLSTVNGRPLLRIRDELIPLINLPEHMPNDSGETTDPDFVMTVGVGMQRAGLQVHGLLGQQDIVIKPLDELFQRSGGASGATVREDGRVSMILDVAALIDQHLSQANTAAR